MSPVWGALHVCSLASFLIQSTVSWPGRRFTFRLDGSPERVGMATGATIHTANGLRVRVTARAAPAQRPAAPAAGQAAEAPALAAAG